MAAPKKVESPTGVVVAQSSGVFKVRGRRVRYLAGRTYSVTDPIVRAHPAAFRPVAFGDQVAPTVVEQEA